MNATAKTMGTRCIVVGEGTLPLACGDVLLAHGYAIAAVVTGDERFAAWAGERGIVHVARPDALPALLDKDEEGIDLLFSIVNPHILPDELLARVRRHAINYHDAPLPRYAGTCATAWALMAGETHHAVSWHLMSGLVDSGDILRREDVEIAPDDTSLSLNIKCYDAALHSFTALADDLRHSAPARQRQDMAQRTFFAAAKRPYAACTLDWRQKASVLSALVRALQFGPYPNALGLPKIWLGSGFLAATQLTLCETHSGSPAGTVLAVEEDSITVSTAEGDVLLSGLMRLDRSALDCADLPSHRAFTPGMRLPLMTPVTATAIDEAYRRATRHENYWIARLRHAKPFQLARTQRSGSAGAGFETSAPKGWAARDLAVAFGAYLARFGGAYTLDLGLQHPASLASCAGLFARTVPLRFGFSAAETIGHLLERGRQTVDAACTNGSYANDLALRQPALGHERANPHWPVIVRLAPYEHAAGRPEACELLLQIDPECKSLRFEYDAASFDDIQVRHLAARFVGFAARLRGAPRSTFGEVAMLDDEEADRIVNRWNDTALDYPKHETVDLLFARRAAEQPDRVALSWRGGAMSYRALDERANRLAHMLRREGAGPETRIALCVERSAHTIVGMLAILKAGAAYVPLDPGYPHERLTYMLEDSGCSLLLTETHLRDILPASGIPAVCLDRADEAYAAMPASHPPTDRQAAPDNLAYVIYTSGSTGRPKGVCITHRAINRLVFDTRYLALNTDDVVAQAANSSFDAITFETWGALLHGCRLHVVDYDTVASPHAFTAEIARAGIGILFVTTALLNHFAAHSPAAFSGVRVLLFGGEAVDPHAVAAILRHGPPANLLHVYGPTESTTFALYHAVAPRDTQNPTIPIGRPIANTRIYVLDGCGMPLPPGAVGELYIGGAGLARGYANRPALSAERFLPDPFSATPGSRMYKTGDLVRYLEDGAVEYIGRADRQVKIRGFRIEPGEIDAVLASLPEVAAGVVLVHEDDRGEKRLVAYASLHAGATASAAALKEALRAKLPHYMVPHQFVLLERMPLTANGKIDREALPLSESAGERADYRAPASETERRLARVWARTLRVPRIGTQDNFFDLGGHSLMGTALMLAMRDELHVNLPLRALFEAPTVAAMARRIEAAVPAAEALPWSLEQNWSASGRNLSRLAPRPHASRSIFLVPGGGGSAEVFHGVARLLVDAGIETYVLHHDGVDNESAPASDIGAMARSYAAQILPHCTGPIALAGYCIGGVIAHEMGKQLAACGSAPRGMLFIDTPLPKHDASGSFDVERARREFFKAICDVHARMAQPLQAEDFQDLDLDGCIALTVSAMGESARAEARLWDSIFRRRYDAEIAHLTAIHAYWAGGGARRFADELQRLPCRLAMVNTSESRFASWPGADATPAPFDVKVVEGRHVTVLQEHASIVAHSLLACFEELDRKAALADLGEP